MIVLALFDVALTVLEWFVSLFGDLPSLNLPASLSIVVPVPLVSSVTSLNAFLPVAVGTSVALVAGKALQLLYSLIPFKAT